MKSLSNKELLEHKEKFAAAFLKETGLDPTQIVMIENRTTAYDVEMWFRPKTEKELKLEKSSEESMEDLRFCPRCPCSSCIRIRESNP